MPCSMSAANIMLGTAQLTLLSAHCSLNTVKWGKKWGKKRFSKWWHALPPGKPSYFIEKVKYIELLRTHRFNKYFP